MNEFETICIACKHYRAGSINGGIDGWITPSKCLRAKTHKYTSNETGYTDVTVLQSPDQKNDGNCGDYEELDNTRTYLLAVILIPAALWVAFKFYN